MSFGLDIIELIKAIGVLGIAAIVFAESGLLIGFFLPGDTLLFSAGFLAHEGALGINIHLLVAILFVAAVTGDSIGYTFGRRVGRRLFERPNSTFFHQSNLRRAEDFYERMGALTIVVARFVPIVRTFAPVVAGIAKMKYSTFLTYNVVGGLLWTAGITYLGYYGTSILKQWGVDVHALIVPVAILAVGLTIASPLWHVWRERQSAKQQPEPEAEA